MILISLANVTKGFPTGDVLTGINWVIKSGEKIALLGRNGSGKTTLMGILTGHIAPDKGQRTCARGVRVAAMGQIPDQGVSTPLFEYVVQARPDILKLRAQMDSLTGAVTESPGDIALQEKLGKLQDECDHAGAYDLERQVAMILRGLGFDEPQWEQPVARFSGGERTRIELARLLLVPVDLLLLDEPTNHLDIGAVEWLEQFLIDFEHAVVLVSHDRVFLDRFAGRVVDLANGRLEGYDGDYRHYLSEKPKRRARREKAYALQRAEIARIEDFIVRNIAGQKTKQAQSRRRALARVERLERPTEDTHTMKLGFDPGLRSFREVLTVRGYRRRIGGRLLLEGVSFVCERGDKIGVIGPNGSGKTTLLRALVGRDDAYEGSIRLGERVVVGYFDQHLASLTASGRVIDEIWDACPHFEAGPLRSYLARFLFTGDDVFKNVGDLSGGEKNRLALAKLMLTEANFLVLDEPTNHLDIPAREVLEDALAQFEGTALVVSHDRRFLDRFATKILQVADGSVNLSLGNYSDWAARHDVARQHATVAKRAQVSEAAVAWQKQKQVRAEARKLARQRRKLMDSIAGRERQLQALADELALDTTARDWQRLAALTDAHTRLSDALLALYEELESLPPAVE